MEECPICLSNCEKSLEPRMNGHYIECNNCGRYHITVNADGSLQAKNDKLRAILSHKIWMEQRDTIPKIERLTIESIKDDELPDPATQLDLLILYLGSFFKMPGTKANFPKGVLCAKIGAISTGNEYYIIEASINYGFVSGHLHSGGYDLELTMKGWQHYQKVQQGTATSRTAFMAMPFGKSELDAIYREVFKPAVAACGFELKRVDDEPRAGLIDDHIRVDIRMSRFVIADLTGDNPGAYWEAGYAEGLGNKPVLYTCSKAHFEEYKTHFDTNHCHTVIWDADNKEQAGENLKAAIRATLPLEARMED